MSLLAQSFCSTHHALEIFAVNIQYCYYLLFRWWRAGGSSCMSLNMNRAGFTVFGPQTLYVPLSYTKLLSYHLGTPTLLQLPNGIWAVTLSARAV